MPKRVETVRYFSELLIKRTKANFDNIIIVDSGSVKGTGKSTFCLRMDLEICRQMGYDFDLLEIVVFDPTNAKIVDKVKLKPDAWPIHVDEASKVAYKRNFNDDAQKQLIIFVNVCRKHHKIIFINNPSFWGLDKDLLDLADFRVTILKRGVAIVRGKSANPETLDKWMRKKTDEAIEKYAATEMDVEKMLVALRNAPNYLFEVHYEALDQGFYSKYEEVSKEAELESFYEKADDKWRIIAEAMVGITSRLKVEAGDRMTWNDIAATINRYAKVKNSHTKVEHSTLTVMAQNLRTLEFDSLISMTSRSRGRGWNKKVLKEIDTHPSEPSKPPYFNNKNINKEEIGISAPPAEPDPSFEVEEAVAE